MNVLEAEKIQIVMGRSAAVMRFCCNMLLLLGALILPGCVTNDFKVVDALHTGMSKEEAHATIASFSFQREQALVRPKSGWPESEHTFTDLPGRAHAAESQLKKMISSAEYYPVGHGLFGFGQLFLFYDEQDRVASFYRRQIN